MSATRFSRLGIPSPRIARSVSHSRVSLLPVQGRAAGVSSTGAPALWVLARPCPGRGSRDHDRIVVSGAHAVSTTTAIRVRANKESRKPVAASGPFPMRTALVLGYTRSQLCKHLAEGTITAVPTIRHRKLVRREAIRLSNPMDPHRNVRRARSRVREARSRSRCPTEAGRSDLGSRGRLVVASSRAGGVLLSRTSTTSPMYSVLYRTGRPAPSRRSLPPWVPPSPIADDHDPARVDAFRRPRDLRGAATPRYAHGPTPDRPGPRARTCLPSVAITGFRWSRPTPPFPEVLDEPRGSEEQCVTIDPKTRNRSVLS